MRGWLLDTNVISELRKAKADAGVTAFIEAQPGDLIYVSEITFGEIRYGIEQIENPRGAPIYNFGLITRSGRSSPGA